MTTVANPPGQREAPTESTSVTVPLPDAVHELIEYEVACARADGYRQALADIAARQVELDETWIPVGRRGFEERVAERIALFERCAADWHARYGTRPWAGFDNRAAGVRPIRPEGQQAA